MPFPRFVCSFPKTENIKEKKRKCGQNELRQTSFSFAAKKCQTKHKTFDFDCLDNKLVRSERGSALHLDL